jgi:hypothetical protein
MRSLQVWGVWLVLISMLLLLPVARAQDSGSIEGQVVNGTAGAAAPGAGTVVTAHVLRADVEVETLQATTDEGGWFRFEGLDPDIDLECWLEATYLDVTYPGAAPVQFDDDVRTIETTITVYETTEDDSAIRLSTVHLIVESFGQVLRISEIHLFSNTGDRAYVRQAGDAGLPGTVFVPLPENGVGLAFGQDTSPERFLQVEGGLLDTEPVVPGEQGSLIFFSYHLMVTGEILPLERHFAYPVTDFNILVAQPGLDLRSSQLGSGGIQDILGRRYALYGAQDLSPNTPLLVELLPQEGTAAQGLAGSMGAGSQRSAAASPGNQGLMRWLGLGLAGLAVAGAVLYPLVTRRPDPGRARRSSLMSNARARALVAELAKLEEAFEAGQVDEASYEQERAARHQALRSLSR